MEILQGIETLYSKFGYIIIFLGSFIESSPVGWITPGNYILAAGGFFANGDGPLSLTNVIIAGTAGSWSMLLVGYYLGLKSGDWIIKVTNQKKNADRAKQLLKHHGTIILSTSLMANVTRFWVSFASGSQSYNFLKFFFYSGIASLTWVSLWSTIGFIAGNQKQNLRSTVTQFGILTWVFLVIALGTIYYFGKREQKQFEEKI